LIERESCVGACRGKEKGKLKTEEREKEEAASILIRKSPRKKDPLGWPNRKRKGRRRRRKRNEVTATTKKGSLRPVEELTLKDKKDLK